MITRCGEFCISPLPAPRVLNVRKDGKEREEPLETQRRRGARQAARISDPCWHRLHWRLYQVLPRRLQSLWDDATIVPVQPNEHQRSGE